MIFRPTKDEITIPVVQYELCPAKTFTDHSGKVRLGRSVFNHCEIVGSVAKEIVNRQPPWLAKALFPAGCHLTAACHDVGKVSPFFFQKIRNACSEISPDFPNLPIATPQLESRWGGHAGVSQLTVKALNVADYIPEILGQHHGFAPPVDGMRARDENFGGVGWQQERERLIVSLKKALDADWPHVESMSQARVLAGLTSVADWIGSGEFFEDPASPWHESINSALDAAGFVPPSYKKDLSFHQVFDFEAREAQQLLIEQVTEPGVYVMEAPMGLGKTEAALYAAYKMVAAGSASGIYFALPTQLTSNKIFERFNEFLARILADDCKHRSLLLHTNAWLLDTDMGEEGRPGGAWFNNAKRGLLAPFAVGTIDQALMSAMNVKHGFVRAFGLAGKVVILDEVHTYDSYTGTLLDALVALLRSLHCTVIILSATLNQDRRQQLLGSAVASIAYPLISACSATTKLREVAVPSSPDQAVKIVMQSNESAAVEQALLRAEQGQQVIWIENTVQDAQQRYLDFAARANEVGVSCGLLHSRFTPQDRQNKESVWVNLFGRHGHGQRSEQGRILVGTQVLEQSLDIDADFMVSRFAPTDMLLQRLGRLWRHSDTPRAKSACCEAWVIAPELEPATNAPEKSFGSSAFVYSPYVLCRSLEVWQSIDEILLPSQIRELVETTYRVRDETEPMSHWLNELDNGTPRRKGRNSLRQLARITLAVAGNTLSESKAQTRYSDVDNHDVLLLRGLKRSAEKEPAILTLLDGSQVSLPSNRNSISKKALRELSATLMKQVVSVRVQDAPLVLPTKTLGRFLLQHCFYLGNPAQDEALLRVALVDESGRLYGVEHAPLHEKYKLEYRDDLGYRVIKI
ncbi:MAG: CRISPR-associated helicase Cas3' [Pseudohongiella sp.]|nr:CRISPR-associated helicase Cas3' [Pseudohongiella sp.]MDP2129039.1 CRISPR-associated helicase Cas3' [Pseudohongiella sp.]